MSQDPAGEELDLVQLAVEGMQRPLFVLDADVRFSYLNPAAAVGLLGAGIGDLVGKQIWAEFPHGVGSIYQRTYEEVLRTGEKATFEAHVARLGRWFRIDVFRTPAGLVVTYDDVTERHRLEQARDEAVIARIAAAERAEQAAAVAERTGRHLMLLGEITQTLAVLPDAQEGVTRLAELCVPLLADWCLAAVISDGRLTDVGRAHRDPAMLPSVHHYADVRFAATRGMASLPPAILEGGALVVQQLRPDQIDELVPDPASREALEPLQPTAFAVFPFYVREEVFGVLTLVNGPERGAFTAQELRSAEIAAQRVAEVMENSRLVAAQGKMAERLQRSLLAPPVQPRDTQLAVRYRPATQGVSLGGDWYDSFLTPLGDTVLVIGDVMGHDVEAAAAMGQVKTLVRGIAYDRLEDPAEVLRRADLAVVGLGVQTMATALVAKLEARRPDDHGPRRVRWSCAGHPQPMLLLPDGTVLDLVSPIGPPVGLGWLGPRVDGTAELPVGSTLVSFTDGLFERRGSTLDDGRARVRRALSDLAGRPLEELCDELLARMLVDGVEDDVALLAVRVV